MSAEELQLMVVGAENSPAWNTAEAWGGSLASADGDTLARVTVVVTTVTWSLAELDGIVAEIRQVIDDLVGPGHMASAGVMVEENAVEVEIVNDAVETVSKALADRVRGCSPGHARRRAERARSGPAKRQQPLLRRCRALDRPDVEPLPAYARILQCGYTWTLWGSGQEVGSTAGHCAARGTVYYNATTPVGTVTHRGWGAGHDGEFITPPSGTTWDRRIWVGGQATTASWPVVGAVDEDAAWVGSPIVISGANGGETRGIVRRVNSQICYDLPERPCVTGTTEFEITEGRIRGGDSGSPCFSSASGQPATVLARGMVTGPAGAGVGSRAHCEPVTDISAALGGSIYTY